MQGKTERRRLAGAAEKTRFNGRTSVWIDQGRHEVSALDSARVGEGADPMAAALYRGQSYTSASILGSRENSVCLNRQPPKRFPTAEDAVADDYLNENETLKIRGADADL